MTTFSAVVCTKGRPDIVKDALAALAACDPPPLEIVVVDGDAAESARPAAEQVGARYFVNEPGLTRQRNRALEEAAGDVVAFIDDDARPAPDVFARLAEAYADAAVVGATGPIVEPGDHVRGGKESPVRKLVTGLGRPGTFTRGGYPRRYETLPADADIEFMQGAFLTVRRDVGRELRFDEALPGYGLAEDEDFSCRLSRRGRIRYVADAVVHHANLGFGTRDARVFNRSLVVNRWHLFRKNFPRTPLGLAGFAWMVLVLFGHRIVNREWQGVRGLAEGIALVVRGGLPASGHPSICFVSSHAKDGGSERYLERLLDGLGGLGGEWVSSVVALEQGPLATRIPGVVVIETGPRPLDIVRSARRLRRHVRATGADLVHANGVKAAAVSVAALLPTVWVKHDHSYDGRVGRLIARRCRVVVGVSEAALTGIGTPGNSRVVHTGMPLPVVDRGAARALVDDLAGGRPVVSLVGRLDPVKGHRELLAAAPDDARLLFVGPDAFEGADSRVVCTGWREDVLELIAGSDVVAVPSINEGFGLVAAEALSVGTPVVGYAVGSLPEVVGECGVLVAPGDVAALAAALRSVLADDARRARLSECGPARVAAEFSEARWLDAMRGAYVTAARASGSSDKSR